MGGAIKRTVLVPLIPIDIWYRIMVVKETEENASETETENPVQASEIRKPECLNSLIRQLVQGIFCDAGWWREASERLAASEPSCTRSWTVRIAI